MSFFLCVISQKPFLEWELEKFLQIHPKTANTIVKPAFYFAYDCREELLYKKHPTQDDPSLKIVIGHGYLSKNTGYAQADASDWEKLIKGEYRPSDIDGHYIALKVRENFLQATNDIYGHCPVYYAQVQDYSIVSNKQDYIAQFLEQKAWNYPAVAALALLQLPLERQTLLSEISMLQGGSTVTLKRGKFTTTTHKVETYKDIENQKYLFALKKAFELQLKPNDCMSLPFENNHAARFAFSIWCHKAKKIWGLYHLQGSQHIPEDYLDPFILSSLKISGVPDLTIADDTFKMYEDFVLYTALSSVPDIFTLAGNFKKEKGVNEINLIATHAEILFEKEHTKRVEKLYQILKSGNFADFKKKYAIENDFYDKEFYALLCKGLELHFQETYKKIMQNKSNIDDIYINQWHSMANATPLAWLNNFRTFYSPAMLHSLISMHLQMRHKDKNIGNVANELHKTLATESTEFPKIIETKHSYPDTPNKNHAIFPLIEQEIQEMIAQTENIPYYKFANLIKIFKRAKKKSIKDIDKIMKWTAFEIWRKRIE